MTPKIYVFCNTANCEGTDWHHMLAISADGVHLASHICSNHDWAYHDMGINPDGWKRNKYAAHYPDGFEVELIEDPLHHAGLNLALDLMKERKNA